MLRNKETYRPFISNTRKELKDFQKLTVDYIYRKLYIDGRDKFLVADEVGLGKTIVAKGLIAKAFGNFKPNKHNPVFKVLYICSNQALAIENLEKLNFSERPEVIGNPMNRLIYLAFKEEKENVLLKFDALTPATSLAISNREGRKKERAVIYSLLAHYAPFSKRRKGLKKLLQGTASSKKWSDTIKEYHSNRKEYFKEEAFIKFRQILLTTEVTNENMPHLFEHINKGEVSIWNALIDLCSDSGAKVYESYEYKNEIIVCLRQLLTKVCLQYLKANLIILDEFQRYAKILGTTPDVKISPDIELAQAVFDLDETKVLLLSATPFKPYTTTAEQDEGQGHYNELKRVLKFLMKKKSDEFWLDLEKDRRAFFSIITKPKDALKDINGAVEIKNRLQKKYKEVILRTERLKVSDDQNILVKSKLSDPLTVKPSEIQSFISLDKLAQNLKANDKHTVTSSIEYSKSCPYPLSFLDNYSIRAILNKSLDDENISKYLKKSKAAWIDHDQLKDYRPLGNGRQKSEVPNSKMQLLLDEFDEYQAWQWLWVPPTISYYKPNKIYQEKSDFSKTLIFSSWKMVPRATAAIMSYEAERQAASRYFKLIEDKRQSYFTEKEDGKRRKPTPILTFKIKTGTGKASSMSLFNLLYPSKYLSDLYDPENNIYEQKSISEIIKNLSKQIKKEFNRLGLNKLSNAEGVSERWYWCAAMLMDKFRYSDTIDFEQLFESIINKKISIISEAYGRGEDVTGKNEKKHLANLLDAFKNPLDINLGKIPRDLFNILAIMCVSSPAVCFMRSIIKQMGLSYEEVFESSYSFGISKMHFFNKPEHITVVKASFGRTDESYWENVLRYCLEGNIQSLLDEFIHLLNDSGRKRDNIKQLERIQQSFSDVLSLKTAKIKVDDQNSLMQKKTKSMRIHYAVDFGTQDMETEAGTGRVINMRQAFNSPYRPFILASTSIGQEGLDFHYYCGNIMHWNLPSNAIDIEQREGRINRYKGLIIRRNVALKYLPRIKKRSIGINIWDALFKEALKLEGKGKGKCELVPYWHVEPNEETKIKRIIPLYPFSKDIMKYATLIETLTYYRLTFGQPRQEELVETLKQAGLSESEFKILKEKLLIDLSSE